MSIKRIIIIGEGQTEQAFCDEVLQEHFNLKGICIENPTTKKKRGGIVNWQALKHQIERHLLQDSTAFVTTLIDYYGLHGNHDYPNWEKAEKLVNRNQRMDLLEQGMYKDIQPALQRRFIPYIQLHEFEGLLFSDINVFNTSFQQDEFLDYDYLVETIKKETNPEMINNGAETAPSKRLAKIIKGYYSDTENSKVVYGPLLALAIGLPTIRAKCPRFNNWITKLENI